MWPQTSRRAITDYLILRHPKAKLSRSHNILNFGSRYELKNFQDVKVREFDVSDVTLDDRIELEGDWPKKKKRQRSGKIVNYIVNETLYFGKGHSVATGSRVTLIFENGTDVDFRWGLFRTTPVLHKLRINYDDFPADAVVVVDIVATKVDRKTEYSAVLVKLPFIILHHSQFFAEKIISTRQKDIYKIIDLRTSGKGNVDFDKLPF